MKVIIFYHATCIYSSRLSLQGVDRIWRKCSVFYLTSRLTRGGYLLVNYQKSIFYVATLIYTLGDFIIDMYVTCEKQRLVLYSKSYKHLMYLWH